MWHSQYIHKLLTVMWYMYLTPIIGSVVTLTAKLVRHAHVRSKTDIWVHWDIIKVIVYVKDNTYHKYQLLICTHTYSWRRWKPLNVHRTANYTYLQDNFQMLMNCVIKIYFFKTEYFSNLHLELLFLFFMLDIDGWNQKSSYQKSCYLD